MIAGRWATSPRRVRCQPSLISIADTWSKSDTSDNGASSHVSAYTLNVAGEDIGGVATCDSDGAASNGVDKETDEGGPLGATESLTISPEGAPVSITLLSVTCESRAVQSNDASSSASASVLSANVSDVNVVVLGSSSSIKTTSGQAGSGQTESNFTVVEAADVTVAGCASRSQTTKGQATESSTFTVLGQQVDADCPLTSADSSFAQ